MENSRIPNGRSDTAAGAIGAVLLLGGLLLGSGSANAFPAPSSRSSIPAHGVVAPAPSGLSVLTASPTAAPPRNLSAAVKHPAPPARIQTRPLIPPAAVPGSLSPPPSPREPLPLQTDLLPLNEPSTATPAPKQPTS